MILPPGNKVGTSTETIAHIYDDEYSANQPKHVFPTPRRAHLVAAAPELLEALREARMELAHWHGWAQATRDGYCESQGALDTSEILKKSGEAIFKATGGGQ